MTAHRRPPNGSSVAPPYDPCGVKAPPLQRLCAALRVCRLELHGLWAWLGRPPRTSPTTCEELPRVAERLCLEHGRAQLYEAWRRAQAPPPAAACAAAAG